LLKDSGWLRLIRDRDHYIAYSRNSLKLQYTLIAFCRMAFLALGNILVDDWMGLAIGMRRLLIEGIWIAAMTVHALHGSFPDTEPVSGVMQEIEILVTADACPVLR
jgi:hypothetical protein